MTGILALMVVKTGDETAPGMEYSPLHMFGTPNVVQNLTFADGDNGWSFNDKNHGTYLFFVHANAEINYNNALATEADGTGTDTATGSVTSPEEAGTVISTGMVVLVGAAGLVAGIFIGAIGANGMSRRQSRI